MTEELL